MTEQEQEHWDHEAGCASEFQNSLSQSRGDLASHNFHSSHKIGSALAQKLFVVVEESTYYCRVTDAIAGVCKAFHSAHATRELAEQAAAKVGEDSQGENNAYVLPRLPEPAPDKAQLAAMWAARPVDDCPF